MAPNLGVRRDGPCGGPVDNRSAVVPGSAYGLPVMSAAAPAAEPPVVPGYTLEALLGRGGSGEVWRAVPRRGGAAVAVKVLVAGDPERQAREAALLGELDHPHLVRLIEVVHQPRRGGAARVALVLELLAGGSLAALLGPAGPAAAGRGRHRDRAGRGGAGPRPRQRRRPRRPVAGQHRLHRRGPAGPDRPRRRPGARRGGGRGGHPGLRRPHRRPWRGAGPGVRRLRRRGRRLPRAHRHRAVERGHPGRHARRRRRGLSARPRRAGPGGAAGADRGHRAAGWRPIRTTAVPRRRSRSTCGTPAARSRCGCPWPGVPGRRARAAPGAGPGPS